MMQAAEAIKQRNKLCRRVQVLSVLAYVASGGLMFLSYQKQIEWLREEIPTSADELVVFCRQAKTSQMQQHRIVRPVCQTVDAVCWRETQGGAAGAYEACFRRQAAVEFESSQDRIISGANRAWAWLKWFALGTCFLNTLVQWYCGMFAASLARNKFLVACYILSNAIFAGYWVRIFVEGNLSYILLLPAIALHLMAAYYASFLLMKQAQVSALPTVGLLGGRQPVNITVQSGATKKITVPGLSGVAKIPSVPLSSAAAAQP